jgi:hypothetical protein
VLDGSGTGQTLPLWSGSGTSNTLTDAPITVSGNNTTFAGNVSLTGGSLSISGDGSNAVTLTESGNGDFTIDAPDDIRLDAGGGDVVLRTGGTEFGRISSFSNALRLASSVANEDGQTRDKLKIYLYNSGTEQYGFTVGNQSDIQYHSNQEHDFYVANSLKVRINQSGNVGIGTTSPQVPLQIGTHLTTAPADTGLCVSNRKSIRINDTDGNYAYGVYMKQNYSGSSYLILGTRHGAVDTDALFVKSGNVGMLRLKQNLMLMDVFV